MRFENTGFAQFIASEAGRALRVVAGLALIGAGFNRGGDAGNRLMLLGLVPMLLGWGIFNLVDGVIDHHLLDIHRVRDMPAHVPAYDWIFLAVGGVLFIVIGWLLSSSVAPRRATPTLEEASACVLLPCGGASRLDRARR
jgi:uncharacterized membrane protein